MKPNRTKQSYTAALQRAVTAHTSRFMLKAMPLLPTRVKRLFAGSPVTVDGHTLDPTWQLILAGRRAAGISGLIVNRDVQATRDDFSRISTMITRPTIAVAVRDMLIEGPEGNIPARLYSSPVANADNSLLVYYHGGGFVFGDLDGYDDLCRLICRDAAVNVLSIDYRLAPEHKAPAALIDACAAYEWAVAHAGELGARSSRVAVGGDSAGANLAAAVSQGAQRNGTRTPALQWLLYPVTHLDAHTDSRQRFGAGFLLTAADMSWCWEQLLDSSDVEITDPQVSPLLAEDLSGQPPAFIVTAGFDPLRDEGEAYGAALAAAGVSVDLRCMSSQVHGFANFSGMGGDIDDALAEILSGLRAHLRRL